ncbi:MAG: Ribonuclease Y [Parcubacteria group bacterium GW2011_GWC1_43_11b]|uniref:Ribonuclease Y n=2 Tax=Candidatus Vogeliibacteriota TaxID=1817922 RepID=A0A1G2QDQ8_9BACT|nr:MAG: Ribonuclease Y [Parcubacteria group bacterium GW2011_GWC1_43_11b]KKT09357.1 MAG: Ribonuclease Y [Parcubacteria group bacterium GW2011_GWA1_43_21]OHA58735.1 MAG: ribonuclease Y [Candidatus Vogelbacteria bacterium RIFOXYB1_FULL_42_16]OHA59714.1 MAG: ribonuclease Y [Candidatus Vogelbacteria bacterium RIFOXYD1_FULL_42_15]
MSLTKALILIIGSGLGGAVIGYVFRWLLLLSQKGSMELMVKQTLLEAKDQAQKITNEAEQEASRILAEVNTKEREKNAQLKKLEDRLLQKDELLDKRQTDIDRETESIKKKVEELKTVKEKLDQASAEKLRELERVSSLSSDEAKEELIKTIEKDYEEDILVRVHKLEQTGTEKLEQKAKDILSTVIQRLSTSTVPEVMSTTVDIPSDDIKGKIIGKEGRNIRAFEKATGVEVIIDDTPGSIVLSSFDPVRRQIARVALENLIADGRIQPAKIEELTDKAKEEISKIIKEKGEQAAYEAGVFNLDPRILIILGRLHFRTSYGQNVLQHSIEMSHLAGMLAEELDADVQISRAGALLHDIGKAVDHEIPGTHVEIGKRILEKFNASEAIVKAMQSHHDEYPYETLEAVIVKVADAISGSRPGARRDSVENYLKRLKDLEDIANSFSGIDKTYAIAAGREIRVFVRPENVNDLEARSLGREIATRIEQELKYPGEIKITIIRETRVIEYAR